MDKFRDLGAIPKAFISDDEMAILQVLRQVNEADALAILRTRLHKA
jgi:hypothetical protein